MSEKDRVTWQELISNAVENLSMNPRVVRSDAERQQLRYLGNRAIEAFDVFLNYCEILEKRGRDEI